MVIFISNVVNPVCARKTGTSRPCGWILHISAQNPGDKRKVNNLAAHLRNAGMVFQNYALWPHLTVEENITFGLTVRAHRASKAERAERVSEMIALLHLEGTEKRMPGQLSGGQQQRVALARAHCQAGVSSSGRAAFAVAIRPEKVRLGERPKDTPNVFPGRLKEATYLGAAVEYRVELNYGLTIIALQAGDLPCAEPERQVCIGVDPQDVIVLPE